MFASWSRPHRLPFVRAIQARPRLFIGFALGIVLGLLLPSAWRPTTRFLIAWDAGMLVYLTTATAMVLRADEKHLRRRVAVQDQGGGLILLISVAASVASLIAIVNELGVVKEMTGTGKALHVGLAALTIVLSWAFIHMMFALHYANEFFTEYFSARAPDDKRSDEERGGLIFPGDKAPDFSDFLYFSYVIGVASQTADVATSSRAMRQIALGHGIIAFFFNTTVLALTINIAAGLI